jgi:hypothetical protein
VNQILHDHVLLAMRKEADRSANRGGLAMVAPQALTVLLDEHKRMKDALTTIANGVAVGTEPAGDQPALFLLTLREARDVASHALRGSDG